MAFCSNCGEQLPEGGTFCSNCGQEAASEESAVKKERKNGSPIWFILLVILVLAGLGGGIYALFTSVDKMTVVVNEQLKALNDDKITKAYSLYTAKEFQKATSLKEFRNFVKKYAVLSENAKHSFHTKSTDENYGLLIGSFFSPDGSVTPVKYQLVKEDNEWKILSIELGDPVAEEGGGGEVNVKELEGAVLNQLNAIRSSDLQTAYYEETAKDFKEATSWEQFQSFLKTYPIFQEYSDIEFKSHEQQGDRAVVVALISSKEGSVPVEYKLAREDGKWKIWSLHLMMPLIAAETVEKSDPKELKKPIEEQLRALKEGNVQKAYTGVSKPFKAATSYEDFESFISAFPVFSQNEAKIDPPYFDQGAGKVRVFLTDKSGTTELEYTLALEEGKWKIWGMQVVNAPAEQRSAYEEAEDFDLTPFMKVIDGQLDAIKKEDVKKAYDAYTSQEFKEATSLSVFKQFLNGYPLFKQHSEVNFGKLMLNNNIASLKGRMADGKGNSQTVEYNLIKERGEWKVLAIKILSAENAAMSRESASTDNLMFTKVDLGTEINLDGTILQPSDKIPADADEIYATLFIKNGAKGTEVTVRFTHDDSGASIPPVATPIQRKGASALSFVFTPPASGWPTGNYSLKVDASTGESRSFPFKIIK